MYLRRLFSYIALCLRIDLCNGIIKLDLVDAVIPFHAKFHLFRSRKQNLFVGGFLS